MPMIIRSPSFMHQQTIPAHHSLEGSNISPALSWSGVPDKTKSLALIVDDPDAPDPASPQVIWVHWVLYNLPADTVSLPEGVEEKSLPVGALPGINDFLHVGYSGPNPPIGKHRYFFKLYALDSMLPDMKSPTKAVLEKAMEGHILAQSELIGLFQRQ